MQEMLAAMNIMYLVEYKEPHIILVGITNNRASPAYLYLYAQSNLSWNFHPININSNIRQETFDKVRKYF